jgi:hypothetical protein
MFRARWARRALEELTALWTAADSAGRQASTQANHQIDQQLQRDPANAGESRPRGRRILFVPPLGALFRIERDGRTVSVLHVWSIHPNRP